METFVTVIHVITALFMVFVILVQGSNSGGVSAAFGGGNSSGVFGAAGATPLLGKLTYAAALIFMITSMSLLIIQGGQAKTGLTESLKQEAVKTEAVEPKGSEAK